MDPLMKTCVFDLATGALYSVADDGGPIASDEILAARGWGKATGQDAIDSTHRWNATTRTVEAILNADGTPYVPPPEPNCVTPDQFVLLFTPDETAAIRASADPVVQQLLFAMTVAPQIDLNSARVIQGVGYLAQVGLIAGTRVAIVLGGNS